jgi:hypothetical protein
MFEDFCSRNMNDFNCKDVITDILIMYIPITVHSPDFHMVLNHITEDQFDATRLFKFAQRLGYKGMKTKSNVSSNIFYDFPIFRLLDSSESKTIE